VTQRDEPQRGIERTGVVALRERRDEFVQRSEALAAREVGEKRCAHRVAADSHLAAEPPGERRPGCIMLLREAAREERSAYQVVSRGREAGSKPKQRHARFEDHACFAARVGARERTHARCGGGERELRLAAGEQRAKAARSLLREKRRAQPLQCFGKTPGAARLRWWRGPPYGRDALESQCDVARRASVKHDRPRMHGREAGADPDDLASRAHVGGIGHRRERLRDPAAALKRAARLLADSLYGRRCDHRAQLFASACRNRLESLTQPKIPPCALIMASAATWNSGK